MIENSTNKQTEENEVRKFYKEMDEKSSHQSCCTCRSFLFLFFVTLIIVGGIIFYLYWQVTRGGAFRENSTFSGTADIRKDIDNIQTDQTGQFEMVMTSEGLTNILSEGLSTERIILKQIRVSINPSNILIYGNLSKPLSSKVLITGRPEVKDEKLQFSVMNVSLGNLNVPGFLTNTISDNFSGLLEKNLDSLYQKYKVEKVILEENQMVIIGKRR
ncbi:hypothetical protein A2V71_00980 [Candidatus Berkelbacteria bacterium RBG_13_40_8]|uniref:Uncharacterized protein n=1 Tax=Candidatus Berkelbacteria bacterium RBG_13_40_8 TaxID=1797467 RepID=A0A1F5DNY5_9BACT|nr:MAG: hypothetical protein A2V71_00980 [Candidatus Berkelbacteria bacterium RBG_13_40_8]